MTDLRDSEVPHQPDRGRRARAVHLDAVRLEDGNWRVTGGSAPHTVNSVATTCDCVDFQVRGCVCKHRVRVLIAEGDAAVWTALRDLVSVPTRTRRTAP